MKKSYPWAYDSGMKHRGKILFGILKPFLREKDYVLDAGCGHSPLAEHIVAFGCPIRGFDKNPYPIEKLKERVPEGVWQSTTFRGVKLDDFTVLLLTGLTGHMKTKQFKCFLERALKKRPRVVLADTVTGVKRRKDYGKLALELTRLIKSRGYGVAILKSRSGSRCRIFLRKVV